MNTESNIPVHSISEGASVNFCTRVELNCIRLFCFEQSYWVARGQLNLRSSSWKKLSELIVSSVCSRGKTYYRDWKHSFQKLIFYFKQELGLYNNILTHGCSEVGSSVEVICTLVTTKGLRKDRCLYWIEVRIRWGFNPKNFTAFSNFNSVIVWVNLISSRLRVGV